MSKIVGLVVTAPPKADKPAPKAPKKSTEGKSEGEKTDGK